MVFSSSIFLLYFFPLFFLFYFLADPRYKNGIIVLFSLFFFMWGAPRFVVVIIASIIIDFYLSHKIYNSQDKRRKLWLILSVCINISILLYFKYANFFVDNLHSVLLLFGARQSIHWSKVFLPIGISFFTFHELSYIIDVYRGINKPMKRISDYAVYILLFPQLIAGPIIRFNEISGQITDRREQDTVDNKLLGFFRFVIGLSKKVLIANVLGKVADDVFGMNPVNLSAGNAWIGILAYTFQIYFDFSGYSDMAIGMARMMGFIFPENFDNPYISQNITEFWKRWHMSLSRWMRDYLYIPLGGNRVSSKARLFFNLWVVFIISGFWHGAAWNFVVWGAYHGLFLIMDRLFLIKLTQRVGKYLSILFTFFVVMIGWVFFRTSHLSDAFIFIRHLFSFDISPVVSILNTKQEYMLIIALMACFGYLLKPVKNLQDSLYKNKISIPGNYVMAATTAIMLLICIGSISSSGFNPFIYFRF